MGFLSDFVYAYNIMVEETAMTDKKAIVQKKTNHHCSIGHRVIERPLPEERKTERRARSSRERKRFEGRKKV